ncbi:vWA domain-containing protein [Weeksella virosa]|uniref:von Willebrand factor type A n=1 Tax=Weeksella virosa (strain ATCC 43766 / DSM 16922 / JCM 21250 / CCUG 30538 / CDC 9751 / IAM 14551 / NBRC 16016 / NCTC 11634 / CL345/78) TaxID=865938 RepID=F0P222_WEEVC|nr:VWA domain-containing protein [Weeksella virosa]ADX67732.1 von Willebrand factor type A [Weeksella virosa DSM 16922]SUP54031.1 Mg-chelatase subunit ChlD [Weeksella virosa]VEH64641.1 Mg-chelatase subunit ChlD [Weeksella virosa]
MSNFEFQHPWFLLLLLLIPCAILWQVFRQKKQKQAMIISTLRAFGGAKSALTQLRPLLPILRYLALALCIVALARPRIVDVSTKIKSDKGVDIMLTVDTSLSMLARDLEPDRLTALKAVAVKFSKERQADRLGLVSYSGEALTRVPLTTDREVLIREINALESGELEDGTAIGIGLATAINHIKDSKAKSKVIILMTDGVESINPTNDLMYISPQTAAEMATSRGIKVYTIGIGTRGLAPFPTAYDMYGNYIFDMMPVDIDEKLLQNIADLTGGLYFRATDNQSLQKIYQEIDRLEKSEINEVKYYNYTELFARFLIPALVLLLIELFLRRTLFKQLI